MANPVEYREAVVIARHRLAIDDARAGAQVSQRLDNQVEAVGQVNYLGGCRASPRRRSYGR
jgi:hypothetical protein